MKNRLFLVPLSIAIIFASCGKKDAASAFMIPKDVSAVVHINTSSLSSKLSWQEITQTNWFKRMHDNVPANDTITNQLLADPASSGVDTKADLIMYVRKHDRRNYMVFAGSLTDAAAFERLCKKMHGESSVGTEGGFSYLTMHKEGAIVWNKSHFAYVSNAPQGPPAGFMRMGGHPSDNEDDSKGFVADTLRVLGIKALSLSSTDNLSDDRFNSLVKSNSDVQIWVNSGQQMAEALTKQVSLARTEIFQGNYTAISIDFDNGKVSAKTKHYFNDDMNRIISGNRPQNISADVINRIPSSNVVAVMAFNYSPAALKEILKATGLDVFADVALADAGIRLDDLINANKGELLVAVCDPVAEKAIDTTRLKSGKIVAPSARADVNILVATSVNDTASFQKMIGMGLGLMKKRMGAGADNPETQQHMPWSNYKLQNNWFAVSNSTAFRDKFLAGGNNNVPVVDKISGHPIGFYVDLSKLSTWMRRAFDSTQGPAAFQDMTGKGGDYKDKMTTFDFEINFVDKSTNSLKQLNQFFDKQATLRRERLERLSKEPKSTLSDSIAVMPKKDRRKVK